MEHDAAYWYRKYDAYMQSLAADNPELPGSAVHVKQKGLRSRQLTLEEFRKMWALILHDRDLTARWIRRLTDGYERDKARVMALLDDALSAVPVAATSSKAPQKDPVAAQAQYRWTRVTQPLKTRAERSQDPQKDSDAA